MARSNRLVNASSPLGYLGTSAQTPANTTIESRAPEETDYKNYVIGDWWIFINRAVTPYTTRVYVLTSLYGNVARWSEMSTSGSSGSLTWEVVTAATKSMENNSGYMADNAAGVSFILPATAVVGERVSVLVVNAGGATIAQNAGQTIHFGLIDSTTGGAGSLSSTEIYDTINLICITDDSDWAVLSSVGNWTIV